MWPFKKKAPKKQPLILEVPAAHREKWCILQSNWRNDTRNLLTKFYFWEFVFFVFPEYADKNLTLNNDSHIPRIEVTER